MLSSDFMKILKGEDYSFLRENEHLAKKIMLLGLSGSYGYGTNRENIPLMLKHIDIHRYIVYYHIDFHRCEVMLWN